MTKWEYLTLKVYEFGSDEGEEKRINDWWVSEAGVLPLLNKLGEDGWEAITQVGRDLIMRRSYEGEPPARAVVEVPKKVGITSG